MNWIREISNYESLPKDSFWVSLQNGKADYYNNHSAFIKRDVVLVFATKEQAEYFIFHWNKASMKDYRQACLNEDFTFWVIYKTPNGYYADDILMTKNWEPLIAW